MGERRVKKFMDGGPVHVTPSSRRINNRVDDCWLYSEDNSLAVCVEPTGEAPLVVDIPWTTIRDAMAAQRRRKRKGGPAMTDDRYTQVVRQAGSYAWALTGTAIRMQVGRRSHKVWTWRVWNVIGPVTIGFGCTSTRREAVGAARACVDGGRR